jgi:uncharacterized integral membrane protein (TIGR00697 family)
MKPEFGSLLNPVLINDSVDRQYKLIGLCVIGSAFIASVLITNVIGTKIMTLAGLNFTAGVIPYAMVFLGTDIIGEVWGKRAAYLFVYLGFAANLLLILFVHLAIISPPAVFWLNQGAYEQTLSPVWRIVTASMIAYIVSQIHDVWAFDFWRRKTKGKKLWLRNNVSTITSQFIDTIVFIVIAFGNIMTPVQVFTVIVGQIIIKWGLALLDTPFIYLICNIMKGEIEGAHESYE